MSRSAFRWSAILCLLVCALGPTAARAASRAELNETAAKRAKIQRERETADAERRRMLSDERSVLGVLQKLDKGIEVVRRDVASVRKDIASLDEQIAESESEIGDLTARIDARRQLVADRLRANYKIGYSNPNGFVSLALRADNLSSLLVRLRYAARIRSRDNEIIDGFRADEAALREHKSKLETQQSARVAQQEKLESQQAKLNQDKRERNAALSVIRRDRGLKERAIREMDASIRQLNALIRQLEAAIRAEEEARGGAKGSTATAPSVQSLGSTEEIALAIQTFGRIDWPVEGKVTSNTSTALEGITIIASEGATVKAVLDGTVEYAQWFNGLGFGKLLVLNHGNGYRSFYAHLSDFAVNERQRVRKGEKIGTVGSTGSLIGPALYFEMRRHYHVIDFKRIAR